MAVNALREAAARRLVAGSRIVASPARLGTSDSLCGTKHQASRRLETEPPSLVRPVDDGGDLHVAAGTAAAV